MARPQPLINPKIERDIERQRNDLVTTAINNAIETHQGKGTYGVLAKHIDNELRKIGITLSEMHLRAIAIETLRNETEQNENN